MATRLTREQQGQEFQARLKQGGVRHDEVVSGNLTHVHVPEPVQDVQQLASSMRLCSSTLENMATLVPGKQEEIPPGLASFFEGLERAQGLEFPLQPGYYDFTHVRAVANGTFKVIFTEITECCAVP